MTTPDAVIAAALALLQASGVSARPVIEVVKPNRFPEHEQTIQQLRGFRRIVDGHADPVVYIVETTDTFRAAAAGDAASTALIASTILHEITHAEFDGSEERALTEETTFLATFVRKRLTGLSTAQRRFLFRQIDWLKGQRDRLRRAPQQHATLFHGGRHETMMPKK